jgi:thiamine-phosphate pyrophosphorylase
MDTPPTASAPLPGFRLYVVTDRRVCGGVEGLTERLVRAAEGLPVGTMAIEVREKDLAASALLDLVCRLREALAPWGVPVLVNDRWDVALAADADGVHLPESGLAPATVRRAWPTAHIGCSTHSVEALAVLRGADFATFGPVFATPSKLAYGPPQGIERLRTAVAASPVPVHAIGGIDANTARQLRDTGIAGIAVIRAVLSATDPAAAARTLLEEAGL